MGKQKKWTLEEKVKIVKEFKNKNFAILKSTDKNNKKTSSTIVKVEDNKILFLREGDIKKEKILSILT